MIMSLSINNESRSAIAYGAEILGEACLSTGVGAAASAILAHPLRPEGGALYGAITFATGKPAQFLINKIFNTDKKGVSCLSLIATIATNFFVSVGSVYLAEEILNVSHSYSDACALTATTGGIVSGIVLIGGCLVACYTMKSDESQQNRNSAEMNLLPS